MALKAVGNKNVNGAAPKVQSVKSLGKSQKRLGHREELAPNELKVFVDAINAACDNKDLPYTNFRLNKDGSPNKVLSHCRCDVLDPRAKVFVPVAKNLAAKLKISFEEAWAHYEKEILDSTHAGLWVIVTSNGKKFHYRPEGVDADGNRIEPVLFHDYDAKPQLNAQEQALLDGLIAKLTKSGKGLGELTRLR